MPPIFGLFVPLIRLMTPVVAFGLIAGLHLLLVHWRWGRAIRAVADDWEAALLTGIDIRRAYLLAFALGTALAGAAGVLVSVGYSVSPSIGLEWTLKALIVVGGRQRDRRRGDGGVEARARDAGGARGRGRRRGVGRECARFEDAGAGDVDVAGGPLRRTLRHYHISYYPQHPFGPHWTFDAVLITFIGGVGTLQGPVLGAIFYVFLKEYLALRWVDFHVLIFGVMFIVIVLLLPGGLVEAASRVRSMFVRT